MPREPRQFKKGGIYHIIKRTINQEKAFKDKQDYSRCALDLEFYNRHKDINLWEVVTDATKAGTGSTLAERIKKERDKETEPLVNLLAFTLMPTHIHLIVREIIEGGISRYMGKLGGYSTYFNRRHNRNGSLFQRYKLVPIESDSQLHIVFAYVHTNPVELWEPGWKEYKVKNKEQALKKLKNYFWTSYGTYIGQDEFLGAVSRDFFLNFFGGEDKCKQVVEDWVDYKAAETDFDGKDYE